MLRSAARAARAARPRRALSEAARPKQKPKGRPARRREPRGDGPRVYSNAMGMEDVLDEVSRGNQGPLDSLRGIMSAGGQGTHSAVAQWPPEELEKLRRNQANLGETRAENEAMLRGPMFRFADETFAREEVLKAAKAPPAPSSVAERLELEPELYVAGGKPSEHPREARGRYFCADAETMARVPAEVGSRRLRGEFSSNGGSLLMVREPAWSLKEAVRAGGGAGARTVTLHGHRGTGKSAALLYTALAAAEEGWLVLHASADELMQDQLGMIRPRGDGSGVYEQPRLAAALMRRLLETQSGPLSRMQARDGSQSLEAMVREGLETAGEDGAPELFARLLDEVRENQEVPTLVLVDNVNAWDNLSPFRDPEVPTSRMPARRLALVEAFERFHSEAPARGMSVFSTGGSFSTKRVKSHYIKQSERSLNVQAYSVDEMAAALAHYHTSNFLHFPIDEVLLAKVQAVSGGNPADVYESAAVL